MSRLDDALLESGCWGVHRLTGQFPEAVVTPDEYTGQKRLALACTQTNLPPGQQRKLVQAWCSLLPTIEVEALYFYTRTTQDLLEAAVRTRGLKRLWIKWSAIKSLEPVAQASHLEAFHLGGAPSATGLTHLGGLKNLRHLTLENIREMENLEFVRQLDTVLELGVNGSMDTVQRIQSLEPLTQLEQLELLWLRGARVQRDGLTPLHGMPNLAALHCAF